MLKAKEAVGRLQTPDGGARGGPGVRHRAVPGADGGSAGRARAIGSAEVLEIVQSRLRVIGEPTRMQIMVLLDERGSATVQELVDRMPNVVTHQNVSRHLRMLYEAGMLRRRREGHCVRYELADWTSLWLLEQVATSVKEHLEAQRTVLSRGARTTP